MPAYVTTSTEKRRPRSFQGVVLALLAGLWLAGCVDAIQLDIEPKQLRFEAVAGEATPPPQTVRASSTGTSVLAEPAPGEPAPDWLDITPASGDEAGSVFQFKVKTTALAASAYSTVVRFSTGRKDGTDPQFVDLPITYTVRPAPKPFAISPGVLSFSAARGQTSLPALGHLTVTGDEAQPTGFSVTATYDGSIQNWLTLPSRGTTPQTFDVGANTTALPAGMYSATLVFTPDNGKPAIQVAVSYSVSSTTFSVAPEALEFTALAGQSALPTAQLVSVSAQGGPPVSHSVTVSYGEGGPRDWLTLPPPTSTPQAFSVRPNTTALPSGHHSAVLTFTPSNQLPPVQVAVVYTVSAPTLSAAPAQLSFAANSNQSTLPAAKTVSVTGEQGVPVNYTVSASYSGGGPRDWLTLPPSGTTPQTLSIRPNTTGLAPGQHTATLRFTPDNGQPAVQVSVVYTVSNAALSVTPSQLSFTAYSNQSPLPAAQSLTVTAGLDLAVNYTVSVSYDWWGPENWLTLASSGTTPRTHNVRPNTTALSPGQYTATLRFTPDNGQPTVQVSVVYTVSSSALSVTPAQLSFSAYSAQSALPAAKSVSVTAGQGLAVNYSVTVSYDWWGPQDWLTLPPPGTTPQTVNVRPRTTDLPGGQYMATLYFTPSNGQPTVQVTVIYTVTAPSLAVAPAQLGFTAYSNQSTLPAAQPVTVTGDQGLAVDYSVSASYDWGGPQDWLTLPPPGTTPQTLDIRPNTTALPPGQHTAFLRFTPDNGQPTVQVSVVYTVSASSLSLSPSHLAFTASSAQSALPAEQTVAVTGSQGQAINYSVSISYGGGGPRDWLALPPPGTTPQTLSLRPNTTALPPGQYTAALSFTPDNGLPDVRLTVSYSLTAAELQVNPSSPALRVDASTQEAGLTTQVALASPEAPLDWRVVSVSVDWLDVTPASGNTQSQAGLNLTLVKGALSELDNGSYSGTVTLAYGNASTPERELNIPVSLAFALPRVRIITPYAVEAGRSLSHILRGENFSSLQSGQTLRFGTTTTSTYEVISDSEIRLTVPPLPAGTHPVLVDNALGLSRPAPNLYAVQTPAMPAGSVARTRYTSRVIYDPRRTAIYTIDFADGVNHGLYRYRYSAGTWTSEPYVTLPNLYDAVMDLDGQSLTMAIGNGIYRLDLDDETATPQYVRQNWGQYNQLEIMNDGYVLDTGSCYNATVSLDGRRAIIMDAGCYSPSGPVRVLDAGSTEPRSTGLPGTYGSPDSMSLDRTARYAVLGDAIYNAQWTLVADATDLRGTLFSQDARRLFGLYADYTQNRQLLRVLDVSRPPVGGRFAQLAELVVPGAQAGDGMYGGGKVLITPDDRTLILVSHRQLRVLPLPASAQ